MAPSPVSTHPSDQPKHLSTTEAHSQPSTMDAPVYKTTSGFLASRGLAALLDEDAVAPQPSPAAAVRSRSESRGNQANNNMVPAPVYMPYMPEIDSGSEADSEVEFALSELLLQ